MKQDEITKKHFDIFIAYHGNEEIGSLKQATNIYNLLKEKKINGRQLEVFLQTKSNSAGQFSLTPIMAQNSSLFVLVASDNIPLEPNGTLLQKDKNGMQKRLYQEVLAFAESKAYLQNPSTTPRVIVCDKLDYNTAANLFFIFNGKNHFSYNDIMNGKTDEFFEWIQYTLGKFDYEEKNDLEEIPILNTSPISFYSSFIVRENELNIIDKKLNSQNFLILTAETSGMGINTLAKNYARKNKDSYNYIHYMEGKNSVKDIILCLSFKGYEKYDLLPNDIQFKVKKDLFLKLNQRTLIVIADFNIDYTRDDYFYDVIASCNCKILITSSYKTNIYPCLEIKAMNDEDLLKLFKHYCSIPYKDEELIEFFHQVNGHTSVITLVANLINSTDLDLPEIMTNMLDIDDEVYLEQTRSYDNINNHLLNVFNLSRSFLSDTELEILSLLSLIDVNGIERSKLTNFLNLKAQDINNLKNKGYVYILEERPVVVFIPTVLSNLIYHNFPPSLDTYLKAIALINSIIKFQNDITKTIDYHKKCCRYGEFLLIKRKLIANKETIIMLNHLSLHYHTNAYLKDALNMSNLAFDLYNSIKEDIDLLKLISINRVIILEDMGLFQEAFQILNNIIPQIEKVDPYAYDLGILYNSLGSIHRRMGNYKESLKYHQKALEILLEKDQNLEEVLLNIATAYNDLGSTYEKLGEHDIALENKLKSLRIREKFSSNNPLDLAKSYNNVGNSFNQKKQYEKALFYEEKSLKIRQEILPAMHPDIAKTLNNLGYSYRKLKKYEDSLACYDKAIKINTQVVGSSVPNLAFSLYHKALVFKDMVEYSKAIETLVESIRITSQGQYINEKMKSLEEILDIFNILEDRKSIEYYANQLRQVYIELGDEKKLKWLREAYEF